MSNANEVHGLLCVYISYSHSGEILGNKQDYKVHYIMMCITPEHHIPQSVYLINIFFLAYDI